MFPTLLSDPTLPLQLRISQLDDDSIFRSILKDVAMEKGDVCIKTDLPSPIQRSLSEDRDGYSVPILFEESGGRSCGCASFTIWNESAARRIGLAPSSAQTRVGYFGDLRLMTDTSRDLRTYWRQIYRAWIEKLLSDDYSQRVDFITTSILDENRFAVRALARGRDGIYYQAIFGYCSLSILLRPSVDISTEEAQEELRELGVTIGFRNPKRFWIVQTNTQEEKLPFFTLSQLDGMENLDNENQARAWRSVLILATAWGARHGRPLFQAAIVGTQPNYWNMLAPFEIQRWVSPATLYQVTLDPEIKNPSAYSAGKYIDAGQL